MHVHTSVQQCKELTTEHAFGGDGAGTLKGPNASSAELIGDGRSPDIKHIVTYYYACSDPVGS